MLPEWLSQRPTIGPCPCCTVSGRLRKSVLERTIEAFWSFFNESSYNEGCARKKGLLQFADPRFKLVGMLWLVVCTILLDRVEWILAILSVVILLAVASNVRLDYYLKRVWFFIPLFTFIISIPAMFNFIIPGPPLFILLTKGQIVGPLVSPWTISITVPGARGAIIFILRTGAAVSIVILFTMTTPWMEMLASLQSLKISPAFVMILNMTYRYVFVLVGIAQEMSMALKSRTLTHERSGDFRKWLGTTIGVLFRRSMNMSELVNFSMIARGYDGKVRSVTRFHAQPFDWAFLGFLIGVGVILLTLRNTALIPVI